MGLPDITPGTNTAILVFLTALSGFLFSPLFLEPQPPSTETAAIRAMRDKTPDKKDPFLSLCGYIKPPYRIRGHKKALNKIQGRYSWKIKMACIRGSAAGN
jgi:hypothetical protein